MVKEGQFQRLAGDFAAIGQLGGAEARLLLPFKDRDDNSTGVDLFQWFGFDCDLHH